MADRWEVRRGDRTVGPRGDRRVDPRVGRLEGPKVGHWGDRKADRSEDPMVDRKADRSEDPKVDWREGPRAETVGASEEPVGALEPFRVRVRVRNQPVVQAC